MHVYRWRQNNSYGRFNGPAHNLVVVAPNVSDAREIVAHYWGGEMPLLELVSRGIPHERRGRRV